MGANVHTRKERQRRLPPAQSHRGCHLHKRIALASCWVTHPACSALTWAWRCAWELEALPGCLHGFRCPRAPRPRPCANRKQLALT